MLLLACSIIRAPGWLVQARTLLVDALDTGDFRAIADPALEGRFPKSEMRRMVEAAAACVRHSAAKRPRMVQVSWWPSLSTIDSRTVC